MDYLQGIYAIEMRFFISGVIIYEFEFKVMVKGNKWQAETVEERFITLRIGNKMFNLSILLKTITYTCKYINERSLRKLWIEAGIIIKEKMFGFGVIIFS